MQRQHAIFLCSFLFLLLSCNQVIAGDLPAPSCPITATIHAQAPLDPGVDPLVGDWYMSADRSIWAMHQAFRAGNGDKVPWIRPAGARLVIIGRRLDGRPATPLKVQIPGNYATAFTPSTMEFPTAGCWEITGKADGKELRFVLQVASKR